MGLLDDSAAWGWKLIENRIPYHEGMDLPRDGPDRPACIVMWYSAPVAEELCEGYTGVQHRDSAAISGERWDCSTLENRWDKMFVPLSCKLCTRACQGQFTGFNSLLVTPSLFSHVYSLPCAGTRSSTWMSSDRHQQPLSRTWGRRGEKIGEAKQPGPATEAVVTRKGEGQHPQKIIASFCKSSSTWKWSTNVAPRSFGANRSTPGKALQAWIHSHGGEFTEESLEALHALQEAWAAEQPGPASPLKTPKARAKRRPPLPRNKST